MKRTLVTVAGATALVAFIFGSPVSAADPVAGCGKGNQLLTIEAGLNAIDWRIYSADEEAELRAIFPPIVDTNGDGWWCMKQFGPSLGISNKWTDREYADYIVTRLSDNNAKGQLG
jgi:hypothetical protein